MGKSKISLKIFPIILVLLKSTGNPSQTRNSPSSMFLRLLLESYENLPSDTATAGEFPLNVLKNREIFFFKLTVLTEPLGKISFQIP